MPCYHPLHGYKSATTTATGKRKMVFSKKGAFVDLPMTVACGQCIGCRIDRSQQWATRITQEAQFHEQKAFLTLTYSPENIPAGATLVKSDLQKFLKRLRRAHPLIRMRYFACGEYGDQTLRPHYHLILFGYDFPDKRQHSINDQGNQTFVSDELEKIWGLGQCMIGAVNWSTAAYVARYVIKKVNGDRAQKHYRSIDTETGETYERQPEFICMSLKPGLGAEFLEKFQGDVYPSDFAIVQGKRKKVPAYYDRQLEKQNPALHARIKSGRRAKARTQAENNTPQRLAVREEVQKAKLSTLKRKL